MKPRIVVSGASRGLGRALVLHLADRFEVTGFARGEPMDALNDTRSELVRHLSGIDVDRPDQLDSLVPVLAEADAIVNNVGIAHNGLLALQGVDSVESVIQTNLLSVIHLTNLYTRARLARRLPGNVVTISSISSIRGFSGVAVYSASKAALNGLTRSLARELGGRGIRFNAVLPGYFETQLSQGLSETQRQQIIRRTPLGRLATPEDICPVVEFLLSEQSRFITGQCLVVDGGLTL